MDIEDIEMEITPIPPPGKKYRACVRDTALKIMTCADGDSYQDAVKNAQELMKAEIAKH